MKKRVLVLAVGLALSLPVLYADIGENFAKGGIGLSGSVSFYSNFYYFLDDTDTRRYWSLDLAPELDYFAADRVALWISPWLSYESMKFDAANINKSLGFGFTVGASRAFLPDPAAQKGKVFSLGAALGLSFYPGVTDLIAGVQTPDKSLQINLLLSLYPRLYFFVNDRLAPFVGVTPRLGYLLYYKDSTGTKVNYTSRERLLANITATIGMSWFIPNKNASLFMRSRAR